MTLKYAERNAMSTEIISAPWLPANQSKPITCLHFLPTAVVFASVGSKLRIAALSGSAIRMRYLFILAKSSDVIIIVPLKSLSCTVVTRTKVVRSASGPCLAACSHHAPAVS